MEKPYKKIDDKTIQRVSDAAFIPRDPMNSDYQEFLRQAEQAGNENKIMKHPDD